jgi:arogenate dehydrogenase (NADP+), plant
LFLFLQGDDAQLLGIDYYAGYDVKEFLKGLDILVLTVPLIDIEDTVQSLSGLDLRGKLIVQLGNLISYPKSILLRELGERLDVDIVTGHAMLGSTHRASSGGDSGETWDSCPFVYEKVRVSDVRRLERFLKIFEEERCQIVEMSAEQHDATIADAEFVTYLTGRLLTDKQLLPPTPILSKEYAALSNVADITSGESFNLFFGMFKYNDRAKEYLSKLRENLARVERQLAAKEAYLNAATEMRSSDRQKLLAETRKLLEEVVAGASIGSKVSKNESVLDVSMQPEQEKASAKVDGGKPKK